MNATHDEDSGEKRKCHENAENKLFSTAFKEGKTT